MFILFYFRMDFMKIRSKNYWIPWVVFIAIGIMLSLLLIILSPIILKNGLRLDFVQILDILCGMFIVCGFGLMLVEKSRYIGLLIITVAIPTVLYFTFVSTRILIEFFVYGLLIGAFVCGFCIYKIRFDWLATAVKYMLDLFLVIFIGYLIFAWLMSSSTLGQGYTIAFIAAILASIGLYYYLVKNLFAITSSDVFVFGPTGSGKSVFLSALNIYLINNCDGTVPEEYIISEDANAGNRLSIVKMSAKLKKGDAIEATRINELAYYKFPSKKWGVIPLNVTAIDYAGGFVNGISKDHYENRILYLAQFLNRNPAEVEKEFGDIDFMMDLKRVHPSEFFAEFYDTVSGYVYARLLKSGKIIFLLDGAKLVNKIEEDEEWTNYIIHISNLIRELGENKDYAFAITKADMIKDIKDEVRSTNGETEKAEHLEKRYIEELFSENISLKAIYHHIMKDQYIRPRYS